MCELSFKRIRCDKETESYITGFLFRLTLCPSYLSIRVFYILVYMISLSHIIEVGLTSVEK